MYYCSSCGESGDGRFCRMCGTALGPVPDPAQAQIQTQQFQAQQYSPAAATQVLGPGQGAPGPEYTGPGPEYDSLFRSDDGSFRSTDRTQLLPPTPVSVDYRMAPPGTSALPSYDYDSATAVPRQAPQDPPPGRHGGGGHRDDWPPEDDEESDAPRKGVIYGTLGAVGVAVAVIAALLYFGTPGPAANSATGANAQASAPAGQSSSAGLGQLQLPSGEPVPTTTPPPVETTPPPPPTTAPATQRAGAGNSALPLSMGSTGSLVKYVQERLHQLNFYNGPDNGQFDQSTAVGVQRFQASAGVQGDPASVVGRSTMTALVSAGSQPGLRPGGGGDSADVKRLQQSLNYAENAGLQVNGKFDATTWTAVIRYQSGVGLAPAGQVTPATWAKLQSGTLVG